MIPIENAFTKCPFCGIMYPLVPPAGERRHDDTDDKKFRGCNSNAPIPNPRNPDDPNGCFTCFSCNIIEGFGSTSKKIKRRFSAKQRTKGGLARCKTCVSTGRRKQFPAFEQECCDNSVGAELHKAVICADVQAVASLLRAGADPDYAVQADITDTYAPLLSYKLLWNLDGSIVHDIYNDGEQPTRPLPLVMFRWDDDSLDDESRNGLNAIATMLIDAGATLSPAAEMVGWRNGYTFEKFNPSDCFYDMTPVITLWRAQNVIRQVLEQCQKHDHFDFGQYFQQKDKDFFPLTEKAVRASSELRPFYYAYTERRAITRLQSHRSSLITGRQQNGEFLPALSREIEARIRSLALLAAENPILASQIPDPIAHDSD